MTDGEIFFEHMDPLYRRVAADEGVAYEVVLRHNKSALTRAIVAMIEHNAALTDSYSMGPAGVYVLLIWLRPERQEAFFAAVKPVEMRYRPPSRFDNGSLIPLFKSPAEELATRAERRMAKQAMDRLAGP